MKKIKLFTVLMFLVGTTSLSAAQKIDSEKRKEIEKMLQLTGMEKLMDQMKGQIIGNFKARRPNVPEPVWKSIDENFDMNELLEMIIPIYDKYYTLEDLKAVNAFYSTPAGQKILSTLPQVMQESMQVGQKWGEQVGLKIARELSRHR
jgi:uncharacterized protein